MSDNQKEVPSSNFDLTGDGSPMYDSDSQLRTAIIRRLLNEYRTTNYFLANAMQSTFLRFFIHDSYSTISPPEYNRPKSDSNYYEPKNSDHIKIQELNCKPSERQFTEFSFEDNNMSELNDRRNEIIFGPNKSNKFSKNNSEFDTLSTNSEQELLTGRTMHCYSNNRSSSDSEDTEKEFKFVDIGLNNETQQFKDKPSSVKSTQSSESEDPRYYSQWKKINTDKIQHSAHSSRRGEKTISCSFNDSNRSTIDKYNDDTNNSSDRKESNCNKGKCKPSELASTKEMASDKKSNSNNEYKIPPRGESKWQVFCELYEELNSSLKEQDKNDYTTSSESIKSSVKYYDSRKTSSHSSLERKINAAINKLKVKQPDVTKTKKTLKNNENFKLKFNSRYNKRSYIDDTSSDTEEVLIRNRYLRNKRIYNTKKYFTNKFRKSVKKRRDPIDLQTSTTSSDDNNFYTPREVNNPKVEADQFESYPPSPKRLIQTKVEFPKFQKTSETPHKMNDKLIHETIFENSDEEPYPHPPFPGYFQTFMDKFNKNYELSHKKGSTNLVTKRCHQHQESSTITCDDYSKNNQSFINPNETSYCPLQQENNNHSNVSIDKIANSGHSTSSFDSIDDKSVPLPSCNSDTQRKHHHSQQPEDLTKVSTSTICLKSCSNGAVDSSGLGTSVSEIKPIENVFIIKKPNNKHFDEITIAPAVENVSSNSSSEWSKICKAKLTVSKLPFRFSSSSKSKSSSDNEDSLKCKPKMRVIFKREATVIDLYNHISYEKTPVLSLEKNDADSRKIKRYHCLRNLFCCCN